jgi:hypothetical protein
MVIKQIAFVNYYYLLGLSASRNGPFYGDDAGHQIGAFTGGNG